jgi:hypothetical protein
MLCSFGRQLLLVNRSVYELNGKLESEPWNRWPSGTIVPWMRSKASAGGIPCTAVLAFNTKSAFPLAQNQRTVLEYTIPNVFDQCFVLVLGHMESQ